MSSTISTTPRKMAFGLFLNGYGHHQAGWLHESAKPGAEWSLDFYVDLAKIAETAKFDLVFLADVVGWRDWEVDAMKHHARPVSFEPLTLLTALALNTNKIGLIATASTTYNEPYNIARVFASLDLLSGGRAGWNIVTSTTTSEALNYSLTAQIPHADRYARADEFVTVVRELWDGWADDAFVQDKQSAIFFDPDRLKVTNFKGKFFSVRGPLNVSRSPQGRPILVQAGSSDAGKTLAARDADIVFTAQPTFEAARSFYEDLKARVAGQGRDPDDVKILPGVVVTLGRTEEEARQRHQHLQELLPEALGLAQLRDLFGGFDLRGFPVDGPVPDIPEVEGGKTRRQILVDMARREKLTIRQLYQKVANARGFLALVGTPEQVADELERWFTGGAADGFNLMPPVMRRDLEDFTQLVIPILQERGLARIDYDGSTLRDHLGLERPSWPYGA